jgi:SulP family sulfate permease
MIWGSGTTPEKCKPVKYLRKQVIKMLKPKFFSIVKHRDIELPKNQVITDIISGIIVAIIALPLSIALAIASGVSPEKGLVTAIIAGFIISFLGGSRVQIGGPTGAFVIIIYGIIQKYGIQGLTIATIMAGIFMIIFGLMRFGTVIKYIPYSITTGFTSGIAVVLFSTQIKDLFGLSIKDVPSDFIEKWLSYFSHFSTINWAAFSIGVLSLIIMVLWPKINKTIPGSLIALVAAVLCVKLLHLPVETIGSRFGQISGTIKLINFADFNISFIAIKELVMPAITIAFLAGIESLLSAVVADGMIGKRHNSNMELVAQGAANIASALFGGIPATGAIARTAANVKNGGRTPIAGMVHSIVLLLIMFVFMPWAKLIPMTTLAAILVVVSYNMSEWRSFKGLLKSTKSDLYVLLVTFSFTVLFDLVTAIEIGMIIAMFMFVKRMSESTQISTFDQAYIPDDENDEDEFDKPDLTEEQEFLKRLELKIMLYEINGPLFFGAANTFIDVMNEIKTNATIIILKMKNVPIMDATAFNALKIIDKRCREKHILLLYAEINEQPMELLTKSGFVAKTGKDRFFKDTESAIKAANDIINLKMDFEYRG